MSLLYNMARKNEYAITVRYLLPYSPEVWEFL
jgi:hypothetical protein